MRLTKLKKIPPIKSVMTLFPYSIDINAHLTTAEEMMDQHKIHHLPVTDKGKLVSVITDKEIRLAQDTLRGHSSPTKPAVRDICDLGAYIVELSEPLDNVLLEMAKRNTSSTLVVKDERLAGIFTMTDACRYFGDFLRAEFPPEGDDQVA